MVDLKGQYAPIKELVNSSIQEVIDTASFINGPKVKEFQANLEAYLGVKHVIPCANGTDALQIAMMGLGLKPGDEVITADFTFAATVEVIALLGLTPVLVDVDPDKFNIDIEAIKKAITPKTKAIVPVHLFGQCANMDVIMELANAHDLFVIEDNAQAIGSNYTSQDGTKSKAGTVGHVASTSFFPSKNLGSFDHLQNWVKVQQLDGIVVSLNRIFTGFRQTFVREHGGYRAVANGIVSLKNSLAAVNRIVCRTEHSV